MKYIPLPIDSQLIIEIERIIKISQGTRAKDIMGGILNNAVSYHYFPIQFSVGRFMMTNCGYNRIAWSIYDVMLINVFKREWQSEKIKETEFYDYCQADYNCPFDRFAAHLERRVNLNL